MEFLLFGSLALLAYTVAGYPVLIWLASIVFPRPVRKNPREVPVSVLICARNEEANLPGRIENLLALRRGLESMQIVVVSDGSTDGTVEAVRKYASLETNGGVDVVELPEQGGKALALNAGFARCRHDIVMLTDARQRFTEETIALLAANLADPDVGAVSGRLVLCADKDASSVSGGIGAYWGLEVFLRERESRLDSTIGVTGAVYAMRRELYRDLPPETILDDVLVPMRVAMAGKRVVYEPRALAYDEKPVRTGSEFTRKVRTLYGNLQLLRLEPALLDPRKNRLLGRFVSHKLLRLTLPFQLLACLAANIALAGAHPLLLAGQLLLYAGALFVLISGVRVRGGSLLSAFLLLNAAVLAAWWHFALGRSLAWKKT